MLHFKYKNDLNGRIEFDDDSRRDFDILREYFKTENAAARFVKSFRYQMSPYIYAITPLGQYAIGLTQEICQKCDELKIKYDLEQELKEQINPSFGFTDVLPVPNEQYKYRDYQLQLIKSLADNGRGVIISPTRSGKSLVIAGLIHNVFHNVKRLKIQNVLILVPNVQLVYQFEDDLKEYGLGEEYHIQAFTANSMNKKNAKIEIDKLNIYIANLQYLQMHGDELPYIDLLFMDEIHGAKKSNNISKLVKSMKIKHKFGCTGTLPNAVIDRWNISGIFGPVVDEVAIQKLQEDKILANVKIYPIRFMHKHKINFKKPDVDENGIEDDPYTAAQKAFSKECNFLDNLETTNKIILNLVKKVMKQNPEWNMLILFDYTAQGEQLFRNLDYEKKFYVDGSVKVDIRKDIVKTMDSSGGNILIAQSKTFSTGITISRLNAIVLFNPGKSATKIIQSIGRGLRRENKTQIVVFDVSHNYKYSEAHFCERIDLYEKFYGLNIGKDYAVKEIEINEKPSLDE